MREPLATRLHAALKRQIQVRIWGTDIHRSAWIHPSALIDRTNPAGVHIGAETRVGEQAVILTHDFTRNVFRHTVIGARCVLGPRAIIMPGVTIGDDCIIAPGSLVTHDVPPRSLAIGNPASVVARDFSDTP
ncbi:MAG TPA: acyltransferase [Caulobacteraceae bacterium]|jgi:acetyltransferase-like isoleucine patch superfamily enzyme